MDNQKGFMNIPFGIIAAIVVLVVITGYFVLVNESPTSTSEIQPTNNLPSQQTPPVTATTPPTTTPPALPPVSDQKQSFKTIAKQAFSGHNYKKDYVIKEISEWRSLWDIINATVTPKPVLPSIDFDDEMVVAVFQGSHPSGGYSIEIMEILEKANFLQITVKETSPSPDSGVISALTQPFHIIKTKRIDKEIVFMR